MIKQETEEETDIPQDTIQIKKEEEDTLSAHDDNQNNSFTTNTEKVTYDLANVKEEFLLSTDDCKPIDKELLRTIKVEAEEKCILPLVPDGQQLLQPTEELILPDLLTTSSSSQNDYEISKMKHLSSPSGSRPVNCIETTNQDSENDPTTVTKSRTRRSIVYRVTHDNIQPTVCHQVIEGGNKLFDNSSSSENLKHLSVDINIEINRNTCSIVPELTFVDSKQTRDNLKLLNPGPDSFEGTDGLTNLISKSNDSFGDAYKSLKDDSISKKMTDENKFESGNKKEVLTLFSVVPDNKNISKNNNAKKTNRVYFSCDLCNRKFDRKFKLKLHKDSKCGSIKLFGCNICTKGFTTNYSLMGHVMSCHISGGETSTFKCDVCYKVYKSKSGLERHHKRNHVFKNIGTLPQTCKYCQKTFNSKKLLRAHVDRMHSSKLFECAHCSKVFHTREGITIHMQSWHLPGQKKCTLCRRIFCSEEDLQKHLKANDCSIKRYICDHCGKAFKENFTLTNHLLTHTDEKQFICQTCGKRFRTETNLIQHSVTHSDVRPFSCDLCSKSFRIRNHLKQHMVVHGLVNNVATQRNRRKKKLNDIKN